MASSSGASLSSIFTLHYLVLRNVTSPEDADAGRKRYCGIAAADKLFELNCDENVRRYLGADEEGKKRKSTAVNMAIRDTIASNRSAFPLLNSGLVMVARGANVDDSSRLAKLKQPSIINGAQTIGVLRDYFSAHPIDTQYPSVNFELLVTAGMDEEDDEELIGDISIARNFQNKVEALSIYGRQGLLDSLERAMQEHDSTIVLRKNETDFAPDKLDTEKLIQVITAITPSIVPLPSAEQRKVKTPETLFRVYAYRHRSRCLKDFAEVIEEVEPREPDRWSEARRFFLDVAVSAWRLYERLKCEQSFSPLKMVKGETVNGKKTVAPDGVPDGLVFPMLSALSRFATRRSRGGWQLEIPRTFPWSTLFEMARLHVTSTAAHNPNAMGKDADIYMALRGAIDMYFAVVQSQK